MAGEAGVERVGEHREVTACRPDRHWGAHKAALWPMVWTLGFVLSERGNAYGVLVGRAVASVLKGSLSHC